MDPSVFFTAVVAAAVVVGGTALAIMAGRDEGWHRGAHIVLTLALLLVAVFAAWRS